VEAFDKFGASGWSTYGCTATPGLAVLASRRWTDTGVNLSAGDRLFIKAGGYVHINPATSEGPAGNLSCTPAANYPAASSDFPAPTLPCWSLIARVGDGPPFEVGTSTLVIAASGRLYMGVNDSSLSNNSGSWKVAIKIGGPPL
jgi:hypothetical protein